MSFGSLYYPAYTTGLGSKPRFQNTHPFRNLVAAGSNMNNQWSGASGQSGYGLDPPDYDYHSGPPAHVPSGGSYSYQAASGTGYGPPAAPAGHPPAKPSLGVSGVAGKKGGGGKKGSSAMSALTLLSFLFFINVLQGCIKDHMDAMNPTVMVMTTNVIRKSFNKMGDMNSREQSSGYNPNSANIVMQPADLVAAAAAQAPSKVQSTGPSVNLQSPYSNNPGSNNKPVEQALPAVSYPTQQQPSPQYNYNTPEPEVPISYSKPHNHDTHKPDHFEHMPYYPPQQQTHSYNNQTLVAQHNPPYKQPALEQQYNYHHTEYNAQPAPQPSIIIPQYSNSQNPFYEHQNPDFSTPYKGDLKPQYGNMQNDYNYRKKYEVSPQSNTQTSPPWSSNIHSSSSSSSVLSGPFRRASVIAVSPKTKWITVPAKITDRTNFDTIGEDLEEVLEHHDDRNAFRRRYN
ncbi:serine/threonine-protein kinase CLA4 [Lucilia cuprina]|uniref:serine/threonine-protein kinase CLA4 n=1 Tax=Lucilia cuprina TaxID=7375 RepID=UPI001F05A812|nr:serine/threonine-protein kinase CLA4 [Lucilia cuprina]